MNSKRIAAARSRVYILVTAIAALLGTVSATGLIPQYTAAEARKHIGERATVIGKVDCIEHGRRHTDVLIGGCDLQKTLLWIVVPDEVSGSKLDCGQLRGVTIAVTGKIEFSGGTPQITINSTSQIVPRTPLNPDYFSSAMEKQSQGDFDGAIADLDRAVELTHEASIYVQRAEVKQKKGDLDGAIADCDRALQLSRGGSKEASALRIQAMRAKGSSKSAVTQRINPGRSQEEQPIAPTTKSGPPVAAGEARPKATRALLVDPTSGQPIGRETYNGSVKVEYSDGRSETFCKDGNCTHPHVSHEGHVGWTHYTHREGRYNSAMNERLVIRFSNGQTKEFKPNPNGGPFIEEWNFIDNDVAVAIKSRGYHGPASFVRYDLISGRMTGHQDGYVEYEKMPEWAQPFSDDIPFPAASKADASEQTLSKQKALKSVNGNVKTQITFVNRSKQGVKVYWLDYSGERVLYRKLKDSESYTQDTYMTHPWLITDLRDNVWQIYMPTLQPRTVIVTAPKKP